MIYPIMYNIWLKIHEYVQWKIEMNESWISWHDDNITKRGELVYNIFGIVDFLI